MHKGDATLTVTAMPGKHATEEEVNELLMPVNGHLLDFSRGGDHLYRLYITGDTMLVDSLEEIPRRYPDIDLGLIHTGGTTFLVTVVTMTGEQGVRAVEITKPRTAIPIHYNDFSVFLSGLDDFKKAAEASTATTKFVYLAHGETYTFSTRRMSPEGLTMTEAYVLGGVRTPFTRYGGTLSGIRTDELLGMTMKGACERVGVPLDAVEDIVAGCVNPAHEGMGDVARWAALAVGFPDSVAGATLNRYCGSSLSALVKHQSFHQSRRSGRRDRLRCRIDVTIGWALMKGEAPFSPRGPVLMLDTMWAGAGGPPNPVLLARNAYIGMIETAQNVADRYSLEPRGDRRFRAAVPAARQSRTRPRPARQGDHARAHPGDEEDTRTAG